MMAAWRYGPLALAVVWAAGLLLAPTSRYQGPGATYPGVVARLAGEALGGLRRGDWGAGLFGAFLVALMLAGAGAPLAGAALHAFGAPGGAQALRTTLRILAVLGLAGAAANGFGIALSGASFGFGGGSNASGLGLLVATVGGLAVSLWLLLASAQEG